MQKIRIITAHGIENRSGASFTNADNLDYGKNK